MKPQHTKGCLHIVCVCVVPSTLCLNGRMSRVESSSLDRSEHVVARSWVVGKYKREDAFGEGKANAVSEFVDSGPRCVDGVPLVFLLFSVCIHD